MSGYTRLVPVAIEAPAEMLESWAGMSENDAAGIELTFALESFNRDEPASMQWLACGIQRRLADIEAHAERGA